MANGQIVSFGPHGGNGGHSWNDGTYNTVREINIHVGVDEIKSIQIIYDVDGKAVSGKKHGTTTATLKTVTLNYPTEYLISISGYHSAKFSVVNCLTLESNIQKYGPYGIEKGTRFESRLDAGKIVGFFGREGTVVDSIGVHITPFQTTVPSVGPFGTTGGQQWDDGTYKKVRELIIYSGWVIDSIQFVYDDKNGNPVTGAKHGADGGQQNTVKLDTDEFLLSFWGYYGQVDKMVIIRSLGFLSNKRIYGPFGVEDGEKFEFQSTGGNIIGFHGRSHKYLTAIGAYLDK
ncbi:jacalin-related lectin 3-like [Cornus florida]|uniref:jacalin-related lectin 3-like n=1 Tax=Cornus florida TaxID=4283 RepID=UPI00289F18ED|nr:jacalin-related lectin 3-like [Cornus florida]